MSYWPTPGVLPLLFHFYFKGLVRPGTVRALKLQKEKNNTLPKNFGKSSYELQESATLLQGAQNVHIFILFHVVVLSIQTPVSE
jgi:hypothetical protein